MYGWYHSLDQLQNILYINIIIIILLLSVDKKRGLQIKLKGYYGLLK